MVTQKKKKPVVILLFLISLSFLMMGFDHLGWLNWLKNGISSLTNPIQEKTYRLKQQFTSWFENYLPAKKEKFLLLEKKNEVLEEKLALLELEQNELLEENEAMRRLLQVPLSPKWHFLTAQVLNGNTDYLLINEGSQADVKEGMVVIAGSSEEKKRGILVGQIVGVNPNSAIVRLPSSPKSEINSKTLNGSKGILKGKVNGEIFLEDVLQEMRLIEDSLVFTTGEEEKFPQGLVIGRISSIEKNESEIYQRAKIKPIVNYQKLNNVFIIFLE